MKRVLVAICSVCAIVAFAGRASAQDKVAKGKQVFADQKCSLCHSIEGKGNPKGSLDGVGAKYSADDLRKWITDPAAMAAKAKADRKPAMPAKYASLPKDDIDALVAYLETLKKK